MVVSMLQFVCEIPYSTSLKDKRRIIKSLKEKMINKFKLSVAEIDLQDSLQYAQLGAALVSNSKEFGETVLNKVIQFIEENLDGRLMDLKVFSEHY